MPLSTKKHPEAAKVAQETKTQVEKTQAEAVATAPAYDESIFGSKSDTIAFVAPLGDPSHPDTTKDKDGNTSVTPYIVGYRFKALADIEVPECGLDEDARKNLMSFKDKNGKKVVKAGETFDLTRFETGLLLAAPEFNGRLTGEGKTFTAVYQSNAVTSKNGTLGTSSASTEIPTVALKAESGSIKDYKIIEVLTYESRTIKMGSNGKPVTRKDRKIIPGFEKWEPLCIVQATRTRKEGSSAPKNIRNKKAEAFLQIVAKK